MWMPVAYRRTHSPSRLATRIGGHPSLSLHSSNEPGELSQWPRHDDSTINIAISISIIRLHRSTAYVDAAYCYRRNSVVCRSVTAASPAKTAEPIEMPFGM